MKCKGCHRSNTYVIRSLENYGTKFDRNLYWGACNRCGYHTSSYPDIEEARKAIAGGEHYCGEGNKLRDKYE